MRFWGPLCKIWKCLIDRPLRLRRFVIKYKQEYWRVMKIALPNECNSNWRNSKKTLPRLIRTWTNYFMINDNLEQIINWQIMNQRLFDLGDIRRGEWLPFVRPPLCCSTSLMDLCIAVSTFSLISCKVDRLFNLVASASSVFRNLCNSLLSS
jgi:hypothetical protein